MLASVIPTVVSNSHRQNSHFLCTWDALLVHLVQRCDDAHTGNVHKANKRQWRGENTVAGRREFICRKYPADQWWEEMINEESDVQKQFILNVLLLKLPGICHQGNSCLKFNLKLCFYLNPPLENLFGGCSGCRNKRKDVNRFVNSNLL